VIAVHQFVPMLHRADAVGRHTLALHEVLVRRGIRSDIYVELVDPDTAALTRPFASYADQAAHDDVLVYQLATASAIANWLAERAETLVVNYHNVTPPQYYAPWDNAMARHQLRAQAELRLLAHRAALGLAVSAFNEAELRAAGFGRTAVVPPAAIVDTAIVDTAIVDTAIVGGAVRSRPPSGRRWVSVGRLAPNKAIEYALMALLVAREHHDPTATLEVVGRPVVPSYTEALYRFVDELGLRDAVWFRGALSDADLVAAMARADVLVLTSQHEGFGVPVIEAMTMALPVVAHDGGALREVVADGGLLVDATDPWAIAGAVDRLLGDEGLAASLAAVASRRLAALDLPTAGERAADLVAALRPGS
jgi:glycosyltransferase involved in cell wall biosynthesis